MRTNSITTVSPATADSVTPRLVVFGLRCAFTRIVVEQCLRRGIEVSALLVPGPPGLSEPIRDVSPRVTLPMVGSSSTTARLPVYQIGPAGAPATRELIASLAPDVIAVACFPTRIPRQTTKLARLGALNVHPSRLPEGRGPDPLFWTLRRGDGQAAVTVHALASRLDAGPIYAQRDLRYPDGTPESVLDAMLASDGGTLLAETIGALVADAALPQPQDERLATYQPWPEERDYVIDTRRSARAAFNFIRGVAERPHPVTIETADERFAVASALCFSDRPAPGAGGEEGQRWIRFSDGWLLIHFH